MMKLSQQSLQSNDTEEQQTGGATEGTAHRETTATDSADLSPLITCPANSQVQNEKGDEDGSDVVDSGNGGTSNNADVTNHGTDAEKNADDYDQEHDIRNRHRLAPKQVTFAPSSHDEQVSSVLNLPFKGQFQLLDGTCPDSSWLYLDAVWGVQSDSKISSLRKAENVVRTLTVALTYTAAATATVLTLCLGLSSNVVLWTGTTTPFLLASILQCFAQCIFPVIAVLEIWHAIKALVCFATARNKNLEKTTELFLALSSTVFAACVAVLFLLGASPILLTGLLLAHVGLSTPYHILQSAHYIYLFLSETPKCRGLRHFFRSKAMHHLASGALGLALATLLVFCLLLPTLGITLGSVMAVSLVLLTDLLKRCHRQAHPLIYPQTPLETYGDSRYNGSNEIPTPIKRTGYYAAEGHILDLAKSWAQRGSGDGERAETLQHAGRALTSELQIRHRLLIENYEREIRSLTLGDNLLGTQMGTERILGAAVTGSPKQLMEARWLIYHIGLMLLDQEPSVETCLHWAAVIKADSSVPSEATEENMETATQTLSSYFSRSSPRPPLSNTFQSFFKNRDRTQECFEAIQIHCWAICCVYETALDRLRRDRDPGQREQLHPQTHHPRHVHPQDEEMPQAKTMAPTFPQASVYVR